MNKETIAILIGVATLVFGDRIIDIVRERKRKLAITELMDVIQIPLSRAIECRCVGKYADAWEYIQTRLPHACSVKDVTMVHGILSDELELYFYKIGASSLILKTIANFINGGYVWRGIVSENIIEVLAENALREIQEPRRKLLAIKEIGSGLPSINFTILEYHGSDRNMEVFFGWGHHKFDDEGCVFSSSDPFLS